MKGNRVNTNDCKIRFLESIDNRKEKQHAIFKFHINHKSLKGKSFLSKGFSHNNQDQSINGVMGLDLFCGNSLPGSVSCTLYEESSG